MSEKESEQNFWSLIGYIKVSPARLNCVKIIGLEYKMPTEIVKESGMRITQISNALHDLKVKGIVFCLNEENIKGRLYQNTELGLKLLQELNKTKK